MSAASKSYIPVPVPPVKRQRRPISRSSRPIAPPLERVGVPVRPVPTVQPSIPPRLRTLSLVQKGISVLTLSLLGSTLGIYAWTVYIPKVWDREFGKLEALQRHERNLLATNETLKHQLAQQAEKPETGFATPRPFQTIFLSRSPHPSLKPATSTRFPLTETLPRKAY